MSQVFFNSATHIQIQGDSVLQPIKLTAHIATYNLVGFDDFPIVIEDYRPFGILAINMLKLDGKFEEFAPRFNLPAYAKIVQEENYKIIVQLRETKHSNPSYMLWIAVGIKESPPDYDYLIKKFVPFEDDQKVLFSLYKRPYSYFPTPSSEYHLANIPNL